MSLFIYGFTASCISCNSFLTTTKLIDLDSLYCLYFFILCLALKPSNYLVENLGTSWSIYCSNFSHNTAAISFKISSMTVAFFCSILYYHSNEASSKSVHYAWRYFFILSLLVPVFKWVKVVDSNLEIVDCERRCRNSRKNHFCTYLYADFLFTRLK